MNTKPSRQNPQTHYVLVRVDVEKHIPDIEKHITNRAATLDGVANGGAHMIYHITDGDSLHGMFSALHEDIIARSAQDAKAQR